MNTNNSYKIVNIYNRRIGPMLLGTRYLVADDPSTINKCVIDYLCGKPINQLHKSYRIDK